MSFLVGKCFVCKPKHKFKYVVFSFWDKYMDHYSKQDNIHMPTPKLKQVYFTGLQCLSFKTCWLSFFNCHIKAIYSSFREVHSLTNFICLRWQTTKRKLAYNYLGNFLFLDQKNIFKKRKNLSFTCHLVHHKTKREEREREGERMCVCVCEREKEREN